MYVGTFAERQGFEPWVPVRVQRFSRPSRSTTPASFLIGGNVWMDVAYVCGCKGTKVFPEIAKFFGGLFSCLNPDPRLMALA